MIISFNGFEVSAINGTYNRIRSGDDIVKTLNNEETPRVRHGIIEKGNCIVEVKDKSECSKTLEELLSLHSGVGSGNYEIIADDETIAIMALVTVSMIGNLGLQVKIEWSGTNGS